MQNEKDSAFFMKAKVMQDKNNNNYYGFKFGPLWITVRYNPNKDNWYAMGKILPPREEKPQEQNNQDSPF